MEVDGPLEGRGGGFPVVGHGGLNPVSGAPLRVSQWIPPFPPGGPPPSPGPGRALTAWPCVSVDGLYRTRDVRTWRVYGKPMFNFFSRYRNMTPFGGGIDWLSNAYAILFSPRFPFTDR